MKNSTKKSQVQGIAQEQLKTLTSEVDGHGRRPRPANDHDGVYGLEGPPPNEDGDGPTSSGSEIVHLAKMPPHQAHGPPGKFSPSSPAALLKTKAEHVPQWYSGSKAEHMFPTTIISSSQNILSKQIRIQIQAEQAQSSAQAQSSPTQLKQSQRSSQVQPAYEPKNSSGGQHAQAQLLTHHADRIDYLIEQVQANTKEISPRPGITHQRHAS